MEIAICVFVVLFLIDVNMISSQIISQTPCDFYGTKPMQPFDKNLYDGQWFTHQQYDFPNSSKYNCLIQIRTKNANGTQNITELLVDPGALPTLQFGGLLTFDQENIGHYIYTSPEFPGNAKAFDILDTDYFNYGIEWNCTESTPGYYIRYLFIISRLPVVTPYIQSKIDNILTKYHIDENLARTLNLTSCPAQLLNVPAGPGLLGTVLEIVAGLVGGVVGVVGDLLGGILG